jgi:hypothetical protein
VLTDLFALGLANLATSFFGTYVASGSFGACFPFKHTPRGTAAGLIVSLNGLNACGWQLARL